MQEFKPDPQSCPNLLVTGNLLFSLKREGLQTRIAPLVGVDYSF